MFAHDPENSYMIAIWQAQGRLRVAGYSRHRRSDVAGGLRFVKASHMDQKHRP
jgi:hypothetical protein